MHIYSYKKINVSFYRHVLYITVLLKTDALDVQHSDRSKGASYIHIR
jgi:hypothetical protein